MMNSALVLSTVNAPYSKKLSAQELAYCLVDHQKAKDFPGHISSFFSDVSPDLQLAFAALYEISEDDLVDAAKAFSNYSGQSYPLTA